MSFSGFHVSPSQQEKHFLCMRVCLGHVRARCDDENTRKACLVFLQRKMIFFYPERPDLFAKAAKLAAELGGELEVPTLPRKYAWLAKPFGMSFAKRAMFHLPKWRLGLAQRWDKIIYECGRARSGVAGES